MRAPRLATLIRFPREVTEMRQQPSQTGLSRSTAVPDAPPRGARPNAPPAPAQQTVEETRSNVGLVVRQGAHKPLPLDTA